MFPSIDPAETGNTGLLWLFFTYGYVLFRASNLISEGSELLLLVPSLAGLVGGVVLPLLGAVPDGAIMLFSGLGDIETAQETLSVGVGALAGSTIMLLTVPWGLSVLAGKVDLVTGSDGELCGNYRAEQKLTGGTNLKNLKETGVAITDEVKNGSKIMILTTIPYFLIQIPASFLESVDSQNIAAGERMWALLALVICIASFLLYMKIHIEASKEDEQKYRRMEVMKDLLKKGKLSLGGVFHNMIKTYDEKSMKSLRASSRKGYGAIGESDDLTPSEKVEEYLTSVLKPTFKKYDKDGTDQLSKSEVKVFLMDFHEEVSNDQLDHLFKKYDTDSNMVVTYNEFVHMCFEIILVACEKERNIPIRGSMDEVATFASAAVETALEDEGEEEEEVPEDIADLPPDKQEAAIKKKAFTMLTIGTILVLLFSDPMVEVMQVIAERADISPFYVSFILAPLAANASEVLASQYYASKKTTKTITVSFSALQGAAAMNNTFCLAIFMGIIFFRGLAWQYTAETITIVLVQFIIYFMTKEDVMTSFNGILILSVFPLSVAFIAVLVALGLD